MRRAIDFFGREVLALSNRRQRHLQRQIFQYWRGIGFPFPVVSDDFIHREVEKLHAYGPKRLKSTLTKPSTVGVALATSFHPQIWEARVRGKSPLDVFNDDNDLWTILGRAPQMRPHRKCWNAAHIRMFVALHNRSRVANFRPTVARVVTAKLSKESDRIVDFCAGYGGRYLGAATLTRSYLGIDPSKRQIVGLHNMATRLEPFVRSRATFLQGPAENTMRSLDSRSAHLVFTSPPYFQLEKYEDDPQQCWRKYPSYEEWTECFLEVAIRESARILRPNGYLAINIAQWRQYPMADDCARIMRRVFNARVYNWHIHMSTNPHLKGTTGQLKKVEPLLIVRR